MVLATYSLLVDFEETTFVTGLQSRPHSMHIRRRAVRPRAHAMPSTMSRQDTHEELLVLPSAGLGMHSHIVTGSGKDLVIGAMAGG